MQISARNTLKGTIKKITLGAVNAEVIIELFPEVEIVSIITNSSVERLGLAEGKVAYAIVKAPDVIIGID
jgi:molybdopterin-binding protein